jgi:3-hydroxyisobutyrate dehydrogenase
VRDGTEAVVRDPVRLGRTLGALHQRVPEVIEGDYGASFKTSLALKDINLILDLANEEHYAARLAPVIASLYRDAVGRGLGEENFTSVVKGYEATAGIRVAESG